MDVRDNDWQYKVVHGHFGCRDAVEALIEEQSHWGWQLVEVVSPHQIRFGRSSQQAAKDVAREGNPYGTFSKTRGKVSAKTVLILTISVALALLLPFLLLQARRAAEPAHPPVIHEVVKIPTDRVILAPAGHAGEHAVEVHR